MLPVRRRTVWLARLAGAMVALAAVATAAGIFVAVLLRPLSFDGVGIGSVAFATLACALLAAFHGAAAFAAGASGLSRGRSIALAVVLLVAGYLLDFVVPLADRLRWARRGSPWWWAIGEQPVSDGVPWPWPLLLVGLAVLMVVVGLARLENRDIKSP